MHPRYQSCLVFYDFKALKAFVFGNAATQSCLEKLIFDSDTSRTIDTWSQPLGDFANNLLRA